MKRKRTSKGKNAKLLLLTSFAILAAIATVILFSNNQKFQAYSIQVPADSLHGRFEFLSRQTSNNCGLQPQAVMQMNDNIFLQGSCCESMDFSKYTQQVEGLKNYSNISQIPRDPYNISVSLAKELLGYDKNITLTSQQQFVYNQAMKMSKEGGPCCCVCWRWYAFEGLAKYLIADHNFTSSQVADVIDLVDGCGGK